MHARPCSSRGTSPPFGAHLCPDGLSWWLSGNESACNAGDVGLIPGSGRSAGEGNDTPLQYSCLGNPMDSGTWRATVHEVTRLNTTEQLNHHRHHYCLE